MQAASERRQLGDFRVMTFDVVGTLIDFERGVLDFATQVRERELEGEAAHALLERFAREEGILQKTSPEMPFTQMLAPIWQAMAPDLGLPASPAAAQAFRESIASWPAFADAPEALARLGRDFFLVAVTNADNWALRMMARTLGDPFEDKVTAEDVGVNKPDPQVFAFTLGKLSAQGFGKADVLHTAQSQYHDIGVAKRLGFATAWIERRVGHEGSGATPVTAVVTEPDFHFPTLAALAEALEDERRGAAEQ
jgi:putative hydrolase of the HAD superfamily